jgi:hypothetical protein
MLGWQNEVLCGLDNLWLLVYSLKALDRSTIVNQRSTFHLTLRRSCRNSSSVREVEAKADFRDFSCSKVDPDGRLAHDSGLVLPLLVSPDHEHYTWTMLIPCATRTIGYCSRACFLRSFSGLSFSSSQRPR